MIRNSILRSRLAEAPRVCWGVVVALLFLLTATLPAVADDGSDRAVAGRRIRKTAEDILSSPEFQNFPRLQRSAGGGLTGGSGGGSLRGLRGGGGRGGGGMPGGGAPSGGMPGGGGGEQPGAGGEAPRRLGENGPNQDWMDRMNRGPNGHDLRDRFGDEGEDFPEVDEPQNPLGNGPDGEPGGRNPVDDPNGREGNPAAGQDEGAGDGDGANGRGPGENGEDGPGDQDQGAGDGGANDAADGAAGGNEPGGAGDGRNDENGPRGGDPADRGPRAANNGGRAEPRPQPAERPQEMPVERPREQRDRSERVARSPGASGFSAAIGQLMHLLAFVVLGAIVALIVWLVFKALKDFHLPTRLGDKDDSGVTLPTADDGLDDAPGGQSPDVYVAQARKLAAAGNYREAIAHLVLGAMSRTERAGWVRFRRGLTVRDYLRALRPHAGQHAAFRTMVRVFEPVSFGRRDPTPELFEQSLAGYEAGFATDPPTT